MQLETRQLLIRAILQGLIIAAFIFTGIGFFADRVFQEHNEMRAALIKHQLDEERGIGDIRENAEYAIREINSTKSELLGNQALIRASLETLNARMIETRTMCK